MKRKFYIIGHNPDTVSAAVVALENGANALEPDITYANNDFYVFDPSDSSWSTSPTLAQYCSGLANELVSHSNLNLALITWDLKSSYNSHFDLWKIQNIINNNFYNILEAHDYGKIPMLFTTPDNFNYLIQWAAPYLSGCQGLGTDQYKATAGSDILDYFTDDILFLEEGESVPSEVDSKLRNHGFCYSYAIGASSIMPSILFLPFINKAISMRDQGNSFSLVYVWTVNNSEYMKAFLNADVDGMITDNISGLKALIDNSYSGSFELARKEYCPFKNCVQAEFENASMTGPPDFKVKTYKFINCEMFVAVNNSYGSTLLKIKDEGATGHDMFDIEAIGNRDYTNLPNEDWLLGTQLFNTFIVDIIYDGHNTVIAFTDGKVLKVSGTGGTGFSMFNLIESLTEFGFNPNYGIYLIGDAKFNYRISCMKYIYDGNKYYLFIGTIDGKLLKINGTGGSGHNMFAVNESTYQYTNVNQNQYSYYFGDAWFLGQVVGMEYIEGFTFIWFNNHKVLKINGTGGSGHNMFDVTETPPDFSGGNYYIGDTWFLGKINVMRYLNGNLFIGFDNGKILQVSGTGGSGHNMFALNESNADFSTVQGYNYYIGDQNFPNASVEDIEYFQGYIMVALKYNSFGLVVKINGYGGTGQNMFAISLQNSNNSIIVSSVQGYNHYAGEASVISGATGLNLINNFLFVEFANGLLLKVNNVGGTGHNMFAITMNQTEIFNDTGYNYYVGEQYFN